MMEFLNSLMPNLMENFPEFLKAIQETMIMLSISGIVSFFFGTAFGVLLIVTRRGGILENKLIYGIFAKVIDFFRSIPFIILVAFIDPLTRMLAGTSIGVKGALVPLIVGTIPYFARQIESALAEVDHGLIEASQAMGSSPWEIITRVYLRESIPAIIRASTITLISLLGFITMVGSIGGGGIGDFAIRRGYNSFNHDITNASVIVLLIITVIIQGVGNYLIKKKTH